MRPHNRHRAGRNRSPAPRVGAGGGSGKLAQQSAVERYFGELLDRAEAIAGIAADLPFEQARQPDRCAGGQDQAGDELPGR